MASQTRHFSTFANDAGNGGSGNWTNMSNAGAEDGVFASVPLDCAISKRLKATDGGFTLPSSNIDGVLIEYKVSSDGVGNVITDGVVVYKAGSVFFSPIPPGDAWTDTPTYHTIGGASDLLGHSWAYTDFNNSGFGIGISASEQCSDTDNGYIDDVRVTVYYTEVADAPVLSVTGVADNGTYAFGSVPVNADTSRGLVFQNTGTSQDTFGTLSISGTGFSIYALTNPSGTTLAAAASVTVYIVCNFATTGAKTGTLTIPSNDAASPYVINLTATAVAARRTSTGIGLGLGLGIGI